jgi:hypothetical protein
MVEPEAFAAWIDVRASGEVVRRSGAARCRVLGVPRATYRYRSCLDPRTELKMRMTEREHGPHRQQRFSLCQHWPLNLLHTIRTNPWKEVVSRTQSKSRRCAWLSISTRSNKRRMYPLAIANMSSISLASFSSLQPSRERMRSGSAECVFASVAILVPIRLEVAFQKRREKAGRWPAETSACPRCRLGDMRFPNGPGRRRKWPKRYVSLSEIPCWIHIPARFNQASGTWGIGKHRRTQPKYQFLSEGAI